MTAQEKLQDRKTRFEHAIRNDAPVGITPLYGNAMGWMVTDSPYTFHEAPYDMKINAEIFKGFAKKYDFDWYCDYGSWCVWKACRAIGHQVVEVSEDGLQYSVRDRHFMEDSEYAAFTRDPFLYRFQTALRRKCEGELTYGQLYDAVAAFCEAGGYMDEMRHFLIEEMGSATVPNNYFTEPMEDFFTYYRGIRGLAVDLRRHKSELKQALDKLAANSLPVAIEMLDAQEPSDISACDTSFMAHTVMNSKQFAELYWPYFKQLADAAEAKDKILSIYLEGSSLGIKDFLQDLPKNRVVIVFEQDNPQELRKALPDVCLVGGFPNDVLRYGTKEENINAARQLIDTMGNNFIFGAAKNCSYKNDADSANMIAVNEFVRSYEH